MLAEEREAAAWVVRDRLASSGRRCISGVDVQAWLGCTRPEATTVLAALAAEGRLQLLRPGIFRVVEGDDDGDEGRGEVSMPEVR